MPDVSVLNASAHDFYVELSDRYYCFVSDADERVSFKWLRRAGFRFGFNRWVSSIVMLRSVMNSDFEYLRSLNAVDIKTDGPLKDKVSIDRVFLLNPDLYQFFKKAYDADGGVQVENACLRLIVSGVKPEKFSLGLFFEIVAAGLNASQVSRFVGLPSSLRRGFYG